jgi:hypothetical protein
MTPGSHSEVEQIGVSSPLPGHVDPVQSVVTGMVGVV